MKLFELTAAAILDESLDLCKDLFGIKKDTTHGKKIMEKGMEVRRKYCDNKTINILAIPFDTEDLGGAELKMARTIFKCSELNGMNKEGLIGAYMYAVYVESLDYSGMSTLEMYYADTWMSAYVEVGWKKLKTLLEGEISNDFLGGKKGTDFIVSESYAPGFDGMAIERIADIFNEMKLENHGLKLLKDTVLWPSKTVAGLYFVNEVVVSK